MKKVIYLNYLENQAIEKIDGFFTNLFEKWQEWISFRSLGILVVGIIIGFVICASIYGILLMKSIHQEELKYEKEKTPIDENKINQIIDKIKENYINESEGLNVKSRFEILGSKLLQTMHEVANFYYPNAKYPLYELTIEEAILFMHYLSNRIDGIFEHPILKPFKRLSISKIFEIMDTKKRVESTKIAKMAKTTHMGKIKNAIVSAIKIINPFHWLKKLVVNSTIDFAMRKVALVMIDIVADETNKTYSKSIFDKEKALRELEIEQALEELEKEEMNV